MASQEDAGPRRYLVVANQTLDSDELAEDIRARAAAGPSEFWIVAPATAVKDLASKSMPTPAMPVMGGVLSVPGTREDARKLAQAKLEAALRNLSAGGVTIDGEVGDADPIRAVKAAVGRAAVRRDHRVDPSAATLPLVARGSSRAARAGIPCARQSRRSPEVHPPPGVAQSPRPMAAR